MSSRYLGVDGDDSLRPSSTKSKRWSNIRNSILGPPASGRSFLDDGGSGSIIVESNTTQELNRQLQIETAAIRKQLAEQVRKGQTLLGLITKMEQEPTENPSAFLMKMASSLKEESNQITSSVFDKSDDLRSSAEDEKQRNLIESSLSRTPWTSCFRGGNVVVGLLSDVYEGIRTIEAGCTKDKDEEVWEAPQTFVRETHKYWVDNRRLGEVMMTCAEELPLLVYGQTAGSLYNADEYINPDEDIFERFASKITSVYFDSPDLFLYRERLARSQGANLVRVRWYGKQPKDDQVLFLELKTHRESWVIDKSAKERVEILERDMELLLQRDNDAWDLEYAESIVVAAKKNLSDDELVKAAELMLRIRNLIIERDLRPCVRTAYTRIAFQSSKSNALRLTMDRDIVVSDETGAPLGAWFSPDADEDRASAVVPCPVFEVKLAGKGMPASVEELILKGAIKNGHKFSKFITGVSVLNAESPHLKTFPYWAAEPIFLKLYAGASDVSVQSQRVIGDDPESDGENRETAGRKAPPESTPMRTPGGRIIEYKKPIAPKTRARIEPKSYFAAERTYIQWVSAALLLVTVASVLDALDVSSTRPTEIIMMILAAMICIYALVVYFRRLFLLENAKPYGYQDHLGPVVLTAAVFFGIITILTFSVRAERQTLDSEAQITVKSMSCVPHNFTGISLLEFQPSDIIVQRGLFLIPSTTNVKGLPKNNDITSREELQSLAVVPRTDMEAITYDPINEIVYTVAERPDNSELLAFRWPENGSMELIGRWFLDGARNVEGMTYVPSEFFGGSPLLLIASDVTDSTVSESNVEMFELPTEFTMNGDLLLAIDTFSQGLLTSGLGGSESTRISAMTEFEGVLYILHDNVRTIRGWDLARGEMVAEFRTPRAGRGSNRQWEGISLERAGDSIVLHMALDTPPQIWSFYATEVPLTEEGGGLELPSCAQAF